MSIDRDINNLPDYEPNRHLAESALPIVINPRQYGRTGRRKRPLPRTRPSSLGAQICLEEIHKRGWTLMTVGDIVGMATGNFGRMLSGPNTPSLKRAMILRELLGAPLESWLEPPT